MSNDDPTKDAKAKDADTDHPSDDASTGAKDSGAKDSGAIRADLNQLWKSTVSQFDEMKDILVRSGSAGKAKLEVTMLKRQQDKLFAELGELVYRAREASEDAAAFDGTFAKSLDVGNVFEKLDALHADIRDQQAAFDGLTSDAAAENESVKEAAAGPAPEVVDAKDPPPSA